MKISVARPHELAESDLARWRGAQIADERLANPFLSPEFALAVGRARTNARVAVLEDGHDNLGYFAYEHGRLGIGRPIGVGISDGQGVVHEPGLHWDAHELLAGSRLAVWEFDHLLAHQASFAPYHVLSGQSPVIDLSGGFDRYAARHRHRAKEVRRTERMLEREVGEVAFDFHVEDKDCLRLLMRWKSAQYRRTGRFDRFANRSIVRVVDELVESRAPGCAGALSVLYAAGQPIAVRLGLRSHGTLCGWFPAFDVAFAKYKPGSLLLWKVAEAAAAHGLQRIDLGKGQEPYKQDFKNADVTLAEGWVERAGAVAWMRRVQRAPRRFVMDFVLSRPTLRVGARRALRGLGYVRTMGSTR
jgi:CelD/BcsL family acetyltransferase involved in cellulose biosynthesis